MKDDGSIMSHNYIAHLSVRSVRKNKTKKGATRKSRPPQKLMFKTKNIIPRFEMLRKPSTASPVHPQVLTRSLRTSW